MAKIQQEKAVVKRVRIVFFNYRRLIKSDTIIDRFKNSDA